MSKWELQFSESICRIGFTLLLLRCSTVRSENCIRKTGLYSEPAQDSIHNCTTFANIEEEKIAISKNTRRKGSKYRKGKYYLTEYLHGLRWNIKNVYLTNLLMHYIRQVRKTFSLSLSTRKIQMCILLNAQLLTIHQM